MNRIPSLFRSLLFWLILTSGVAYYWPVQWLGVDPIVAPTEMLWALIAVTMFSLGTLVKPDELTPLRERPWWVVLGVTAQVLVMPLAAWIVVRLIPMPDELAAGVILVGCVPGAMASNVLTHTAGGSVAYSVSLTAVATMLSPLTVPAVLWAVADLQTDVPLSRSAMLLATLVVLPTVIGYFASQKLEHIGRLAKRVSPVVASIALLWIIASVVAANRDRLAGVGVVLIVALLLINLLGYFSGFVLARFAKLPDRYGRALTLEIGMQNAGLGTALAATLYGSATTATIPTAAYTFGCMLTGTLLAIVWKNTRTCDTSTPDP